jgi:hypothetical protein
MSLASLTGAFSPQENSMSQFLHDSSAGKSNQRLCYEVKVITEAVVRWKGHNPGDFRQRM